MVEAPSNLAWRAALAHVEALARGRAAQDGATVAHVLSMSNVSRAPFDEALQALAQHARVALHFHPDRRAASGQTVIQGMLEEGRYRNQFESHVSNGLLDPEAGGTRASWEDRLFGGAFRGAPLAQRPRYGALDLMGFPDGPAPRFGSCFLVLRPEVAQRCTFTWGDSHADPPLRGTMAALESVMAGLLEECFVRHFALGRHGITPRALVEHLRAAGWRAPPGHEPGRSLDHYIEAQVHGELVLARDASGLVADPGFRGTEVGEGLEAVAARCGLALSWNGGWWMPVEDVPDDFRGPTMPALASRVAPGGVLDPALIGEAAAGVQREPGAWAWYGSPPQVLQGLKLLWHVLVRCGRFGREGGR